MPQARPLLRPARLWCCLALSLIAAAAPLRAQQPINPNQPPTPASPEEQRKKTPPVPPGSVLPSYNNTKENTAVKVQPVPTSPDLGILGRPSGPGHQF